jgi:hypothetical protein
MSKTLGAFFICYKEREAVEKAVASYFKYYPNGSMYISSDGGMDFEYLKGDDELSPIEFSLDQETTVGVTKNIEKMIQEQKFPLVPLFRASMDFLHRLERATSFCCSDYLLLMEPDVFLRGKLNLDWDFDLIGPKPNQMPDHVRKHFIDKGGKDNIAWGAAAGCMRVEPFLSIYHDIINNPHKLLELLLLDPRIACYDYLLTALFSLYGYRYDENPDLTECQRNPGWQTSNHPLLHQYRENYGNDPSTNKHLSLPQNGSRIVVT